MIYTYTNVNILHKQLLINYDYIYIFLNVLVICTLYEMINYFECYAYILLIYLLKNVGYTLLCTLDYF